MGHTGVDPLTSKSRGGPFERIKHIINFYVPENTITITIKQFRRKNIMANGVGPPKEVKMFFFFDRKELTNVMD